MYLKLCFLAEHVTRNFWLCHRTANYSGRPLKIDQRKTPKEKCLQWLRLRLRSHEASIRKQLMNQSSVQHATIRCSLFLWPPRPHIFRPQICFCDSSSQWVRSFSSGGADERRLERRSNRYELLPRSCYTRPDELLL